MSCVGDSSHELYSTGAPLPCGALSGSVAPLADNDEEAQTPQSMAESHWAAAGEWRSPISGRVGQRKHLRAMAFGSRPDALLWENGRRHSAPKRC